ncbi:MAG: 2,3-bisphosphoglycerate-independent phosphoglycerate mutase [Alphaproteobacteria bacterium]
MQIERPVILCILDGWGYRKEEDYNAVKLGKTPNWDRLVANELTNQLYTFGAHVGLPDGQMGNSEVGHMNIGAGRIVMQDLPRITKEADGGKFLENKAYKNLVEKTKASGGACHVFIMLSNGGVHNHMMHGIKLVQHLSEDDIPVVIHGITDGRDVPPKSGENFAKTFEDAIKDFKNVTLGSVVGRYFAMDRDNRWERVSQAYFVSAQGKAEFTASSISEAINAAYERGETDEFIQATTIGSFGGIKDGDSLAFTNFRADRAREILRAYLLNDFDGFERGHQIKFSAKLGFVEYSDDLAPLMDTMFYPVELENILAEIISNKGLKQYHTAETEKYPHVTFFFNGGREQPYEGEDRFLVPSPKVKTYDLKPEMSALEVCDGLIKAIESKEYAFIVVNFANGDMVGHTGVLEAAIKAVETVDQCLGRIDEAVRKTNSIAFITADHGNAEEMWDYETNGPHTAHTTNMVDGILVNAPDNITSIKDGKLGDIAPTILELLEIEQPKEMTGESLIVKK